jgi:hypothetical protein
MLIRRAHRSGTTGRAPQRAHLEREGVIGGDPAEIQGRCNDSVLVRLGCNDRSALRSFRECFLVYSPE